MALAGAHRLDELGAGRGAVVSLARTSYLALEDRTGGSSVRLVVFNSDDPTERLSLSHTRIAQGHLFLAPTSSLVSNRRRPLARICEDDVRAHDIVSGHPCGPGLPDELLAALEEAGVPPWSIPDSVNLFTPVAIAPDGSIERLASAASPGDRIVLLAALNLVCGVAVEDGLIEAAVYERMPPLK